MNRQEFVNGIYQAALSAGMSDAAARVTASQAAVESNYGKSAPGNNYFGIKAGSSWDGPVQMLWTHEVNSKGKSVRVKQPFRVYSSPEEGLADRAKVMDRAFPGFAQAQTVGDAYNVLQNGRYGRYATAKRADYENALNHVNTTYLGGNPVPPGGIGIDNGLPVAGRASAMVPLPAPAPLTPESMQKPRAPLRSLGATAGDTSALGSLITSRLDNKDYRQVIPTADNARARLTASNVPDATDPRLMSLGHPAAGGDVRALGQAGQPTTATGSATLRPASPIIPTTSAPAGSVQMAAPRPASVPVPPSDLRLLDQPVAPTPMPGRPADQVATAAPTPMPGRPADTVQPQRAATAQPALLKLPSGKTIAAGTYPASDGHHSLQISDDGSGNAVIKKVANFGEIPGLIDPLRESNNDTVAGGVIRSLIPKALNGAAMSFADGGKSLGDTVSTKATEIKNTATKAVSDLGEQASGLSTTLGAGFAGLGNSLGAMFGGQKPQPQPRALGNTWAPVAAAAPIQTTMAPRATVQHVGRSTTVTPSPMASSVTNAVRSNRVAPEIVSSKTAANTNTGGSSGGSAGNGGQTITGSATGRQYVVGQQYSNGNGTYVATSTGFKKVA